MRKIQIEPTEFTPGVLFDSEKMIFKMWGKSRPEDLTTFYFPLIEWWKDFAEEITSNLEHYSSKEVILNITIDYFNSASSKMIYDIINLGKSILKHSINYKIHWHYYEDDEDIYDSALELAKELDMEFNMIVIKY